MWCVRVHDDGSFRAATRGNELVLSLEQWHGIDPTAAEQFDTDLIVQRRFMQAVGLPSPFVNTTFPPTALW